MSARCLICGREVHPPVDRGDDTVGECPGCGCFSLPTALIPQVEAALQADPGLRPRLSRVLRLAADRRGGGHVEPLLGAAPAPAPGELGSLLRDRASIAPFPRTLGEKLDVALLRIAALSAGFGDRVRLDGEAAFCARIGVLADHRAPYTEELVRRELTSATAFNEGRGSSSCVLTAAGWARVEALQNGVPEGTLVFLALSNHYGPDGDPHGQGPQLRDAIAAALPPPLSAYRVENDHGAVDITDEIVANIRRARFVVADLTGARPNVYFEAGLAMGLGKPVVFTRRTGEAAHFDVAAYKIIEWAPGGLGAFTPALKDHLVARALIPAV